MPSNFAVALLLFLTLEVSQAFRAQTADFRAFQDAELHEDAEGSPDRYDKMCAKKVKDSHKEEDTHVEKKGGGFKNFPKWLKEAELKDLGKAIKNRGIATIVDLKCQCVGGSMILATRDGDIGQNKRTANFDWQSIEEGRFKCMSESERLFREAKYYLDKAADRAVEWPEDVGTGLSVPEEFQKLQLYGTALRSAAGALENRAEPFLDLNDVQWEMSCGSRPNRQSELETACGDVRFVVDAKPLLPYTSRYSALDALLAIMGVEALKASGSIEEDAFQEAVALLRQTAELLSNKEGRERIQETRQRVQEGSKRRRKKEKKGKGAASLLQGIDHEFREEEIVMYYSDKKNVWMKAKVTKVHPTKKNKAVKVDLLILDDPQKNRRKKKVDTAQGTKVLTMEEYQGSRPSKVSEGSRKKGLKKMLPIRKLGRKKSKDKEAAREVQQEAEVEEADAEEVELELSKEDYTKSLELAKPMAEKAGRALLKLVVELQPDIDRQVPDWPQQKAKQSKRSRRARSS